MVFAQHKVYVLASRDGLVWHVRLNVWVVQLIHVVATVYAILTQMEPALVLMDIGEWIVQPNVLVAMLDHATITGSAIVLVNVHVYMDIMVLNVPRSALVVPLIHAVVMAPAI